MLANNHHHNNPTTYKKCSDASGPGEWPVAYGQMFRFTLTGKTFVHLRALRGSRTLTLPAGIYIVRTGNAVWKVMVD